VQPRQNLVICPHATTAHQATGRKAESVDPLIQRRPVLNDALGFQVVKAIDLFQSGSSFLKKGNAANEQARPAYDGVCCIS
jgi:hypothetical protein